jgi:hypothetical protein
MQVPTGSTHDNHFLGHRCRSLFDPRDVASYRSHDDLRFKDGIENAQQQLAPFLSPALDSMTQQQEALSRPRRLLITAAAQPTPA